MVVLMQIGDAGASRVNVRHVGCGILALGVMVGVCVLWLSMWQFQPRSVDLSTVSELTGLHLPGSSELLNSYFEPGMYDTLIAHIKMAQGDATRFRSRVPAIQIKEGIYAGGPRPDWFQPQRMSNPETLIIEVRTRGRIRLVHVIMSRQPADSAEVYLWSTAG